MCERVNVWKNTYSLYHLLVLTKKHSTYSIQMLHFFARLFSTKKSCKTPLQRNCFFQSNFFETVIHRRKIDNIYHIRGFIKSTTKTCYDTKGYFLIIFCTQSYISIRWFSGYTHSLTTENESLNIFVIDMLMNNTTNHIQRLLFMIPLHFSDGKKLKHLQAK